MKKRLFLGALLAMTSMAPAPGKAEDTLAATNLHSLITKQQGWLNTSRALKPDDLKGRILLLDFWTFCCINCMHVIPDLQYLEEKFGADLTVIGVHSAKFKNEGDSENIRQAILRYGIRHPVVNDFDFTTWKSFGIRAWPTFVLINPKGIVEATYSGEGNRNTMERDIKRLQEKYEGRINTAKLPLALEQDKQKPGALSFPGKIAYTPDLNGKPALFVSDSGHQRIVVMNLQGGIIDSIGSGKTGGVDGDFASASFNTPQGMVFVNNVLYIADTNNHLLRSADFSTRKVTTLAGTGAQGFTRDIMNKPALQASLASPWDVAAYPDDKHIAIAMAGLHQLWVYDIEGKTVSVVAGNGAESIDDGRLPYNSLSQPSGLSAVAGKLYFVDSETSSLRVFENGEIHTLIGTGLFDFGYKEGVQGKALMQHPLGLVATDKAVYIADSYNHSIRTYDVASGTLSNLAGHGVRGNHEGAGAKAEFNEPNAIIQVDGKFYIADTNNNAIRVMDAKSGAVSTLKVTEAASAADAEFSEDLPNFEAIDTQEVVADGVAVSVGLQKGWHINADAPTSLVLFDMTGKPKAVAAWDKEAVKTLSVMLPKLTVSSYRLQGTLYYCEDKAGSQCQLKSFDVTLKVKADGGKSVALKLN